MVKVSDPITAVRRQADHEIVGHSLSLYFVFNPALVLRLRCTLCMTVCIAFYSTARVNAMIHVISSDALWV